MLLLKVNDKFVNYVLHIKFVTPKQRFEINDYMIIAFVLTHDFTRRHKPVIFVNSLAW